MKHQAAKFVIVGALLAAASLSVRAETAPVANSYHGAYPFADAQAAADYHKAMLEQQEKAFEAQRRYADEMAKRFAQAPARPEMPAYTMPYGQPTDQARAQMQAQAMADQYRKAALAQVRQTPPAYPISNDARPEAPVMDPAFDPAKVQAQYEAFRQQMDAQRAEFAKWAEEQRKAAAEQHAAMRKEMEAFRANRKI